MNTFDFIQICYLKSSDARKCSQNFKIDECHMQIELIPVKGQKSIYQRLLKCQIQFSDMTPAPTNCCESD
jgi:hypothetical protein